MWLNSGTAQNFVYMTGFVIYNRTTTGASNVYTPDFPAGYLLRVKLLPEFKIEWFGLAGYANAYLEIVIFHVVYRQFADVIQATFGLGKFPHFNIPALPG